jgi:hypothetical protein
MSFVVAISLVVKCFSRSLSGIRLEAELINIIASTFSGYSLAYIDAIAPPME